MKVYEETQAMRLPRDASRTTGLHLSDILRSLAFMTGVLDNKYDVPIDEQNNLAMHLGVAWEDFLAAHIHPEISFHPGELYLDGIAMSPDGVSVVDQDDYADLIRVDMGTYLLHEMKLTYKSSRDFRKRLAENDKKARLWLWQIKAYRHAMNKLAGGECPVAKLHVMFINGNYSHNESDPESGPTYKIFRLHFDAAELQSNWDVILSHRDYMLEQERLKVG